MRPFLRIFMLVAVAAVMTVPLIGKVYAQMNNRPYSFRNSPGGLGMSDAGRQAIINRKVFNETPENLMRGPDGLLLDVFKGPGNVVILRREGGGGVVPGYRGRDFRGGNADMRAGVFNLFFSPAYAARSLSTYEDYQTAAIIGAWIASVEPGIPYDPANPVTSWTVFVYSTN